MTQEVINIILGWPPGLLTVLGLTLMMYVLRFLDAFIFQDRIKIAFSVIPRSHFNPFRLLLSPWVHKDKYHLYGNIMPFVVLGCIIALGDLVEFWFVTVLVALIDGLGTWIAGSEGRHLGASGLVMGYFSYIVARGFFTQNAQEAIIAMAIVLITRSSIIGNLRFRHGSSNVGHWIGFLGGIGVAFLWTLLLQEQLMY